MNSRERVLDALERKPVDRIPFVETTIGLKIGEALLGRATPTIAIPRLGTQVRNVEDDKALSRLLHRDNISVRITAPIISSGNSIPDCVLPGNMLAFARGIRDFGAYGA